MRPAPLLLVALVTAGGCWAGPRVGDPQRDEQLGEDATFQEILHDVLVPSCASSMCHAGFPPARAPMSLEEDRAYDELVGAPASQAGGMLRVAPGDPANSYLVLKLRNTQRAAGGSGMRMPLGQQRLTEETIARIEGWIARGAPND